MGFVTSRTSASHVLSKPPRSLGEATPALLPAGACSFGEDFDSCRRPIKSSHRVVGESKLRSLCNLDRLSPNSSWTIRVQRHIRTTQRKWELFSGRRTHGAHGVITACVALEQHLSCSRQQGPDLQRRVRVSGASPGDSCRGPALISTRPDEEEGAHPPQSTDL
uniref:Uncharacterized protein n=1 Tax=Knipowitschia caucasica TaxID=637954 RepID=A0AAV2L870_KNICA